MKTDTVTEQWISDSEVSSRSQVQRLNCNLKNANDCVL